MRALRVWTTHGAVRRVSERAIDSFDHNERRRSRAQAHVLSSTRMFVSSSAGLRPLVASFKQSLLRSLTRSRTSPRARRLTRPESPPARIARRASPPASLPRPRPPAPTRAGRGKRRGASRTAVVVGARRRRRRDRRGRRGIGRLVAPPAGIVSPARRHDPFEPARPTAVSLLPLVSARTTPPRVVETLLRGTRAPERRNGRARLRRRPRARSSRGWSAGTRGARRNG